MQEALQRQLRLNNDGSPREEGKGLRRGNGRASSPSSFSSPTTAEVVGEEKEVSGRVVPPKGLKGALLVILKAETALTASREEVRRAVEWVLESVRREDRAMEMSGGKVGRKGQSRGESRSMKGGGKGLRASGGRGV